MRRRLHVASVIAVAFLMAMHAPAVVGQTGGTLVVGSQHDTAAELSNAQELTNVSVVGSGADGSVSLESGEDRLVEGFEGDLSSFGGDLSAFATSTAFATEGSQSLEFSSDFSNQYISDTDVSVSAGSTISYDFRSTGSDGGFHIATQDESSTRTGYAVYLSASNDEVELRKFADGSLIELDSVSTPVDTDTVYEVSIDWGESGAISVSVVNSSSGAEIGSVNATDSTFESGGIGVNVFQPGGANIDAVRSFSPTPDTASYVSPVHQVSNPEEAAINITELSNVSVDAEVRTEDGTTLGSSTITSSGNQTIALSNTSATQVETVLDVTVTGSDPQFELADESILFVNEAPEFDNASATPTGNEVLSGTPTLSINVSDGQFGTAQGESLTVEWYVDGDKQGETTTTSNGTASYELASLDGGQHNWSATITDSYGASTTTQTYNFSAPSELRVYNESSPSQLIDENVSLRVRFFADDTEQVIEREVTDGTVDLAGLPATQRYTVTVAANQTDKWTYRRVVIDSLIETSSIYLLPSSEPQAQIVFELDDPTGQFPPEETTLYVEKPISKDYDGDGSDETRYQVIAGDIFGASGDFPAVLEENSRYRLRVETGDGGSSRILGFYSVSGAATETLTIERVAPTADADEGAALRAQIEEDNGQDQIAIRYQDFNESTISVEYEVVDANGTVVVANTTRTADEFADIYPVPAGYGDEASFTVNYRIVREQSTSTGSIKIGQLSEIADRFGLDPQILTILSYLAIIGTMGLVVINNQRVAPFAGTAVASGLTVIGTVAIPLVVLSVAGLVSIMVLIGGGQ